MPQEQKNELSPEAEIRELERRLEEKKRMLAAEGAPAASEKEIFREALREHIGAVKTVPPEGVVAPAPIMHVLPDDLKKKADDLKKTEEREIQVRGLIEIALARSIQDAVRVAESATPYLLDELHDHLADDYYEKLIAARKLKQL